jgi:hypothetical protein
MGRAASELDVQSPQFEALPKKSRNLCQIFKMQVEQSTLQRLANKEVGWTMSDQEEAAIYQEIKDKYPIYDQQNGVNADKYIERANALAGK